MLSKEEMDKLEAILFGHDELLEKIRQDEKELEVFLKQQQKYKENQRKGIERAKRTGYIGRKNKIKTDEKVKLIIELYDKQYITSSKAARILGISRATFYRLNNEIKEMKQNDSKK